MGLFGDFTFNEPKKKEPSLVVMAETLFGKDTSLMIEIKNYLASRKQLHNLPSKVSWKMQLEILQEIPEEERVSEVRNCTIKGYRQIAYKKTNNIRRNDTHNRETHNRETYNKNVYRHKNPINIVNQAF